MLEDRTCQSGRNFTIHSSNANCDNFRYNSLENIFLVFIWILPGWGATEYGDQSEFLQRLDVTVNSTSRPYHIETNVGPHGADPCAGDSGGPLLMRGPDLQWLLIGTLEGGGYDCNKPFDRSNNISNWNRIDVHLPWIESIIRGIEVLPLIWRFGFYNFFVHR